LTCVSAYIAVATSRAAAANHLVTLTCQSHRFSVEGEGAMANERKREREKKRGR